MRSLYRPVATLYLGTALYLKCLHKYCKSNIVIDRLEGRGFSYMYVA